MENGSIEEVQELIDGGRAKVMTASELKRQVREGRRPSADSVDVVTCATFGVMSGTMAVLTVPVSDPGEFRKADSIMLNGVPATVGPCPNESLGIVDCILHGTSRRDARYGGGHLLRDIVRGDTIDVTASSDGRTYRRDVTIDDIPFARVVTTRSAFKNYTGFVNSSDAPVETIFSAIGPMDGGISEASVSGCGEINPLENDPRMEYLHQGASVMLNGAPGMVIGTGTRSTPGRPNLSVAADMHLMDPSLVGGFITSAGPECMTSVGVALPVTGQSSLDGMMVLDEDIILPLADIRDRRPVHEDRYSSVWSGDAMVSSDASRCLRCGDCHADAGCPAGIRPSGGIDPGACVSCGHCVSSCAGGVFRSDMGSVMFGDSEVPITLRQSSRPKAERICRVLADMVRGGSWKLLAHDMLP